MNHTQTIKFYKKRAIVAECDSAWLRKELDDEELFHYEETESLRVTVALLNQQLKQRGYH
jgi:hypothetical protein